MVQPIFDFSTGWWTITYRTPEGTRRKRTLRRDPRWRPGGDWPGTDPATGRKRKPRPPADVQLAARPFQDADARARLGIEPPTPGATDLAGYLEVYRADREPSQAANTVRLLRLAAKHFLAYCAARKVGTVERVTAAVCRGYLAERAKAVGRKTLQCEKGVLSPVWTRAMTDGLVMANPWKLAPVPGRDRAEAPAFWTAEQVARLAEACQGTLRDVVLVGANTGIRISALTGLTWDDVDFGRGVVVVRATASKSGRRYEVPMSEVCRSVLERRRFLGASHFVFPGRDGGPVRPNATWKALRSAVQRAGIPDHGRFNHLLRHSFASNAILAGVPIAVVSKWLGHASIAQTMVYSHLCESESARMMEGFSLGRTTDDAPRS